MEPNMAFVDFEDEDEPEGEDVAFKDDIVEPTYRDKSGKSNANSNLGRAPTVTIEVVRVIRPLKIISLLLAIMSLGLMIAAACLSSWMYIGPAQMGLFHECYPKEIGSEDYKCSKTSCYTYFFFLSMILAMVGILLLIVGIVLFIAGILVYVLIPKRRLYNATVGIFIFAALFYSACLVTHPVLFLIQFSDEKFQEVGHSHRGGEIAPGYALFIGVGGVLLLIVSTILLIVDKRVDEIIYLEKINQ
ncbi:hypothetical protein Aperf_G00000001511 [Anoplocephala perfoliata]